MQRAGSVDGAAPALDVADGAMIRDGMPRVEGQAVDVLLLALRLRRVEIATRYR
jgi:hypothetical protein